MKNDLPSEPNESLSKVLKDWKVTTPLPPRFQEQVWQRISRTELPAKPHLWTELLTWLDYCLPRRALAASYLFVLLLAGVAGGYWRGQERAAQVRDEMGSRYVQSVDPYQALVARK